MDHIQRRWISFFFPSNQPVFHFLRIEPLTVEDEDVYYENRQNPTCSGGC
jgi:hypothetical protein